ncbi:hypothetical protein QWY31_14285 [Cytophagales bacterium LB-30]|uniref:Uncharacterized protein n=1 Tax=Shiella aurantiaca TaxID=3058365 RepID=A0ABT8F871_9BACT|nr:hypothetical protein [Shiella aurantiaca]MDN4166675.1 hypothetical protein [Shiella aurantiaca]
MSSHHIVRDEQEPALLLLEASEHPSESILSLLEWSPTVVVASTCLANVLAWGIKVDVVIGPKSEEHPLREALQEQYPVQLLCFEKPNYLEDAINYLLARKHKALNCIGGTINYQEPPPFEGLMQIVHLTDSFKAFWVADGHYEKWWRQGVLLAFEASPETQIQGLQNLGNGQWKTEADQLIHIRQPQGFWIKEPISI